MLGSKDAIRIVPYFVLPQFYPIFAYREAYAPLLCSYRGGSLSHKTTPVQAHRGFRLLTLASFQYRNTENEASCQRKRLSKRLSFTSFCASGNDLFFRRGNERDENAVKRRQCTSSERDNFLRFCFHILNFKHCFYSANWLLYRSA